MSTRDNSESDIPRAIDPIVLNAEGETLYVPEAERSQSRPHTSVKMINLSGRPGWLVGLLVLAAIPVFLVAGVAIAAFVAVFGLIFWIVRKLSA